MEHVKTSLYELSSNYMQALDFLTDPENDIDNQTLTDTIEGLDGELDDKMLNVGRFIASMVHEAEGIKEVERRQTARRKSLESKIENLKHYLKHHMTETGHKKIKASDIALSLVANPASVQVIDESLIPDEFWRVVEQRSIDKTAIKEAGGCAGVEIASSGYRVSIK